MHTHTHACMHTHHLWTTETKTAVVKTDGLETVFEKVGFKSSFTNLTKKKIQRRGRERAWERKKKEREMWLKGWNTTGLWILKSVNNLVTNVLSAPNPHPQKNGPVCKKHAQVKNYVARKTRFVALHGKIPPPPPPFSAEYYSKSKCYCQFMPTFLY